MVLNAKVKVIKHEKGVSGPDKPIRNESFAKELIVEQGSIIRSDGNLLVDKDDVARDAYVIIDKITPEEIEFTAYGFPNQTSSESTDLDGEKQHFTVKKYQQLSLNFPLLGGSMSLTILFLGLVKLNQ